MAEFLGDLTVLAATTLAVWGLLLYQRGREAASGLIRVAGLLALLVGIGTALCAGFYMIKYQRQGDFDHAYPARVMGPGEMTMPGMQPGMQMSRRGMGRGMPMQPSAPPQNVSGDTDGDEADDGDAR